MTRIDVPLGLLFSNTGSYGTVAHTLLNGAKLACKEINADPNASVMLKPLHIDPQSNLGNYGPAVQTMLDKGIRHICGCYTSSSRKEVIPLIEKRDALLWYPTHYEGFESTTNVIYTGAAPNHHISPLIDYLFTRFGQRAFCIGSNYIWGWESNRVLREGLQKRGGEVLAERYVPVGETDLNDIIEEILETRPNFVFNALIGESSYSFFRAFRNACREKGIDQVAQYPVASCNLSEPELRAIGADGADGQISSSVYFSSLPGARNARFVRAYQAEFPEGPVASAEAEAAYVAIHMLAKSVAKAGTADVQAVCQAVAGQEFDAPQGKVTIDPDTLHASLTPRIGLSRSDYEFDLLFEASEPVKPDPYLVSSTMTYEPALRRSMLRAVS
ncbi:MULTISPECIES: transporter substrate-binding domain-containing protein [Actibacterium]|uniref:Branched-chain amino acid transport system substrate-binding protein n=1 Tax=Actibacterium naphthalenivorans TaxID=1614693 RepID=A0A840CCX6_9RHOB|nr:MULTISPECIES: transporter substrate-binding domain-containing protein [Actibacterium]ALG90503.1 aliphatic amidase expression-regulating protein [Actibacterium sp. EMB200-NS6]MBB4023931.1 branched-chain amino acid transport system substrate-binding protein [Actibacterium naphthalenivorans]